MSDYKDEIIEAVIAGDVAEVERLLLLGADITVKKQGSSLLSLAVKNKCPEVCDLLITNNVPIGGVVNGHAVIYNIAAFNYSLPVLKSLIENGLPYNFESLLKEIAKNCDFEALRYVVDNCVRDQPRANILPELVKKHKCVELEFMIQSYYTHTEVFDFSEGVVLTAVNSSSLECLLVLLENNVAFGVEELEQCCELGALDEFKALLKKRNVNLDLNRVLWKAVEFGRKEMLDLLLEAGADIKTKNLGGQSLVYIARANNQKKIVSYLFSLGLGDDTDKLAQMPESVRLRNLEATQTLSDLIGVDADILKKHLVYPLREPVGFESKVSLSSQHKEILEICDGFYLFDNCHILGFNIWGSEDFKVQWYPELTDDCLKEDICPLSGSIPHNVSVRLSDGAVVSTDWECYTDKEYFGRKIEDDIFTYIRTVVELWEKYDESAEDGDDDHSEWWGHYASHGDREDLEEEE